MYGIAEIIVSVTQILAEQQTSISYWHSICSSLSEEVNADVPVNVSIIRAPIYIGLRHCGIQIHVQVCHLIVVSEVSEIAGLGKSERAIRPRVLSQGHQKVPV